MDKNVVTFKDIIKREVISLDAFVFLNYVTFESQSNTEPYAQVFTVEQWDILTEHPP